MVNIYIISPRVDYSDCSAIQLGTTFSSDEEEGAVEEDLLAVLKVRAFASVSLLSKFLIISDGLRVTEYSAIFTRRASCSRSFRF